MNIRPRSTTRWPAHEPRGTRGVRVRRSSRRAQHAARLSGGLEALPRLVQEQESLPAAGWPRRSRPLPSVLCGEAWAQDLDGAAPGVGHLRGSCSQWPSVAGRRMGCAKHHEAASTRSRCPGPREEPGVGQRPQGDARSLPPTLAGRRDKAILLVGFCGAFRRSDLVNLDIEDLAKADEGLVLMVRKGKTDQKREGRKIGIPYGKDPLTCPVRALCEWIAEAQITSGPLFRAVTKFGRPRPTRLCDRVVAEIVKKYCKQIGKRVPLFSGHSLRAGFATSAAIAGASERSIQKQTGHASVNVLRQIHPRGGDVSRQRDF